MLAQALFPLAKDEWFFWMCMMLNSMHATVYGVADLPLVVSTLPSPAQQAFDVGLYFAFGFGGGRLLAAQASAC